MNYRSLLAKNIDLPKLADPAYMEQLRKDWSLVITNNQNAYDSAAKVWRQMCLDAEKIWSRSSVVYKYICSHKPPKPPDIQSEWGKLMKRFKTWQNKEAKRIETERRAEEQRQKARDYRDRRAAAVEELIEVGYEPNEHFRKTAAISFKKKVLVETPEGEIIRALPVKAGKEREW